MHEEARWFGTLVALGCLTDETWTVLMGVSLSIVFIVAFWIFVLVDGWFRKQRYALFRASRRQRAHA